MLGRASLFLRVCVHICVCTCVEKMCLRTCMCLYICVRADRYVVCACVSLCMCLCLHTHTHTHIHTHTRTHTHAHTPTIPIGAVRVLLLMQRQPKKDLNLQKCVLSNGSSCLALHLRGCAHPIREFFFLGGGALFPCHLDCSR